MSLLSLFKFIIAMKYSLKNEIKNEWCCTYSYLKTYTALQKFGNALKSGVLDNIGMNPF